MSLLRHSLHIASKQLFYLLVISLVLVLIGMAAAVWLSDNIAKRKDEIAAWTSEQLGQPVEIGGVSVYWLDLFPKLEVSNVRVLRHDGHTPILAFKHLYAGLDLIRSVQQQQVVIDEASLRGVSLYVTRKQNGQFDIVDAAEKKSSATNNANWLAWLSIIKNVDLHAVDVMFDDEKQPQFSGVYSLQSAVFKYRQSQWKLKANLKLPQRIGGGVSLNGNVVISQSGQFDDWHLAAEIGKVDLQPLVAEFSWHGIKLTQGWGQANIVLDQHAVSGTTIKADVDLTQTKLSATTQEQNNEALIQDLSGHFEWRKQEQGWQLDAQKVQITMDNSAWPQTHFSMTRSSQGDFNIESGYLRLSDVTSIALMMQDAPDFIVKPKPAGDLASFTASYKQGQGITALSLDAKEVATLPWKDFPGVTGLSFSVDWQDGKGTATLDSHKLILYPEAWLKNSVYLDSVAGTLNWQDQPGGWVLTSHNVRLWNDDFNLQLDGTLENKDGHDNSDLTLKMQDVKVNRWKAYVPKRILDDDFWDWAENAFVEGTITQGQIDFKGDPTAFPFDIEPDKGSFDMMLKVQGVQLHYAPGWPNLIGVDGTIEGKGNDLIIKSQSGTIDGLQFKDVTTAIDNLVRDKPILTVNGQVVGTSQQALTFLQHSPLKKRFGKIADWVKASGQSDVDLQLKVPLTHVDNTYASGHVSFKNSSLSSASVPLVKLTHVAGKLAFSNDGVEAKNIKAISFGQPVKINVMPQGLSTVVSVTGDAPIDTLRKSWPQIIPDFINGKMSYQTQVTVNEKQPGQFDLGLSIKSDLKGVKIDMPAPLGKTAEQSRLSELTLNQYGQDDLVYTFQSGDLINAIFVPEKTGIRGEIRTDMQKATLPKSGITIKGHVNQLSLDDWLAWQHKGDTQKSPILESVDAVSMSFDSLQGYGHQIHNLTLNAHRAGDKWQGQLKADLAKGSFTYPLDDKNSDPIKLDLDYLNLTVAQDDVDKASQSEQTQALWPSIDLRVNQLSLNKMQLGKLVLKAQRQPEQWQITTASLQSDVVNATASGSWSKQNGHDLSQFSAAVHSDDLKALLARLGYQQAIQAKKTRLSSKLSWPGAPTAFSFKTINGEIAIKTGRGELINVEPGAAGRIFGLLSFAAIPRRLSLDFSDLFGKGFGFSGINGKFDVANGVANTDDLIMQGDSATITVTGAANLVDKTYDQKIKITPNVSSTLPLAGAVAGGPVGLGVGTAIMLFDKIASNIFDKEIVNVISYSYNLTGPWSDPQLNIVKPATQ